jgi:flagellar M-ring protein FliF
MFVMKSLLGRLKNEKILIGSVGGYGGAGDLPELSASASPEIEISNKPVLLKKKKKGPLSIGDIEDEITDEAAQKLVQQEKIVNYVSKNPSEAAKLINSWLHEDEY